MCRCITAVPTWVVVDDGAVDRSQVLRAEDVLLVSEIMSPGSITTDRKDKPAEYAEARIPHFWRIEFDVNDRAGGVPLPARSDHQRLRRHRYDRHIQDLNDGPVRVHPWSLPT